MAIVIAFGLGLFLVTFRSGSEEALDASSYPDGQRDEGASEEVVVPTHDDGRATFRPDDPGARRP